MEKNTYSRTIFKCYLSIFSYEMSSAWDPDLLTSSTSTLTNRAGSAGTG